MQRTDRGSRRRSDGPAAGLIAVALAGLAACPGGGASRQGAQGNSKAAEAGGEPVRNADGVLTPPFTIGVKASSNRRTKRR